LPAFEVVVFRAFPAFLILASPLLVIMHGWQAAAATLPLIGHPRKVLGSLIWVTVLGSLISGTSQRLTCWTSDPRSGQTTHTHQCRRVSARRKGRGQGLGRRKGRGQGLGRRGQGQGRRGQGLGRRTCSADSDWDKSETDSIGVPLSAAACRSRRNSGAGQPKAKGRVRQMDQADEREGQGRAGQAPRSVLCLTSAQAARASVLEKILLSSTCPGAATPPPRVHREAMSSPPLAS